MVFQVLFRGALLKYIDSMGVRKMVREWEFRRGHTASAGAAKSCVLV